MKEKDQLKEQIKNLTARLDEINQNEKAESATEVITYLEKFGFKKDQESKTCSYVLVLDDFLEFYVSIDDGLLEITDIKAQDTVYKSHGSITTLYERLTQCPPINIEVTHVNYIIGGDYPALDHDSYGIVKTYRFNSESNDHKNFRF